MIALKIAVSIFLFFMSAWIFMAMFATTVLAMGPYWTIAVLAMCFGYHRFRVHERKQNQQRGYELAAARQNARLGTHKEITR